MKIINLQAENLKRLVAVEITPTGALVQITGKNGAGKTSVLDSIFWALAGAGTVQPVPIRKGQKSARIRLDLGEIVVTRTFKGEEGKATTTAITVENGQGARFPSPQRMLDDLLGTLSFDPLAFARMLPREQFDELRRFVPGVDFDAIEKANAADYADRTTLNRRAKEERAVAASIAVPADAPDIPVDEGAIAEELEQASERNADHARAIAAEDHASEQIARLRVEADHLEAQAKRLRAEADRMAETSFPERPAGIDVGALGARLKAAQTANIAYRAKVNRHERVREAEDLERKAEALTAAMAGREALKREAVAAAEMPVPGLQFGEGVVLMDGVPFDQASDAEKLRVSVAIAMASNPKLRVVRVRDGSLLDAESLQILGEMAADRDYQVWIERVDDTGKVGFVIEDGRLKTGDPSKEA